MVEYLLDLYRRYSPVISPAVAGRRVCTPPLLSRVLHAYVRVGAPAVLSYASEAKRKRNEIPLSINNIQYLLTVTEKI